MNGSAAAAIIQRRLGYRDDADEVDHIIAEMQLAQMIVEQDPAIPPLSSLVVLRADVNFTASVNYANLPTDFLHQYEHGGLWRYDATVSPSWVRLRKDFYDFLNENQQGTAGSTAYPTHYAVAQGRLWVFKAPYADITLKFDYVKKDADIAAGAENEWLKHATALIIGLAGKNMAQSLRNDSALAFFEKMEQQGRMSVLRQQVNLETSAERLAMGGDD